jgi:branched-chain amino acid transport system substrate-binding protein
MSSGDWFPQAKFEGNKQFIAAYLKAYHGTADQMSTTSAEAYSAGEILAAAVAQTHSIDNGKIISALHKGVWHTITGNLRWNQYGEPNGETTLVQWVGGKLVPVYPASVALHKPILKPAWH